MILETFILKERHKCRKIYYFAGVEIKNEKQRKFYNILKKFGYELILKPVKIYKDDRGRLTRKANCDVDLTFFAMRDMKLYDKVIFMTGDGDFSILFDYLKKIGKNVRVVANGKRTAKEVRRLLGPDFTPMKSLITILAKKKR